MLYKPSFFSRVAVLAVALPVVGFSASIGIDVTTSNGVAATPYSVAANGPSTSCGYGSCTSASLTSGAIGFGASNSGSYGFNITLADGDIYNVAGSFNNTFLSGTYFGFFPKVTFEGNSIHTAAGYAVAPDTITLDMLQDFVYGNNSTDWSGTYTEKIPLVMSNVPGSTASGQLQFSTLSSTGTLIDGPETVGELGPAIGSGIYTLGPMSTALNPLTGNYLASDFQLTFVFQGGTGTPIGGFISSPSSVPEPAQTIPAAMGLVGLFLFKARKFRFGNAK